MVLMAIVGENCFLKRIQSLIRSRENFNPDLLCLQKLV